MHSVPAQPRGAHEQGQRRSIHTLHHTTKRHITTKVLLTNWKHHAADNSATVNTITNKVVVRTERNTLTETFTTWAQHTHTKTKHTDTIQYFLKGSSPKTYTIAVPSPVTLDELSEGIAKKTLVPAGEQRLGPMRNFVDKNNTDLFHIRTSREYRGVLKYLS